MTLEGLIAKRKTLMANVEDSGTAYAVAMRKLADKIERNKGIMFRSDWMELDQAVLNARKAYMEAVEELDAINSKNFEF